MRNFLILLICMLAASLPLASNAAPGPPQLGRRPSPVFPRFNSAPAFSGGATLSVKGHGAVAVLNWSTSTSVGSGGQSGMSASRFGISPVKMTANVTVPLDKTSRFLQQDAAANRLEATVVLKTPNETFTLRNASVSSFSINSSGNQTTAQFTLSSARIEETTQGGTTYTAPCPAADASPLICFPQLRPIVVGSWSLNTSNRRASQLTFSATLGSQVAMLQRWAFEGHPLKHVTLLTPGTKYVFTNVLIGEIQVQGSGMAPGQATVTFNFQRYAWLTK